jgi:hypothetical protein
MSISSVNASGIEARGPVFGPYAGWSAIAIADAPDGDTGRCGVRPTAACRSRAPQRSVTLAYRLGAYLDWSAQDITVGADGRPRLLRTSPSGLASIVTIDEAGLPRTGGRYTLPGFTPRRIAAADDGVTRVLFSSDDGQGEVLLLDSDNHADLEEGGPPARERRS